MNTLTIDVKLTHPRKLKRMKNLSKESKESSSNRNTTLGVNGKKNGNRKKIRKMNTSGAAESSPSVPEKVAKVTTDSGGVIVTVYVESSQPSSSIRTRVRSTKDWMKVKANFYNPRSRRRQRRKSSGGGGCDRRAELLARVQEMRKGLVAQQGEYQPIDISRPSYKSKRVNWMLPLRKIRNALNRVVRKKNDPWKYERIETEEESKWWRGSQHCPRTGCNNTKRRVGRFLKKLSRVWSWNCDKGRSTEVQNSFLDQPC